MLRGAVEIPRYFYRLKKFATLKADVMFVSGTPFLVTFSQKIKMITTKYVHSRTVGQLAKSLTKVVSANVRGVF